MKTKPKRWLFGAVAVLVAGFIMLNALAYRQAYAMMHFTTGHARTQEPEKLTLGQKVKVLFCGVRIPRPQIKASPTDLGPATRSLLLDGTNGIKLGAWYCPGTRQDLLVILFHGYTSEKSGTLPEAKAFLEMGLSVLLVDFRGSGDSSESYTTIGFDEAEDVAAAVRYAQAHFPHRKVILYGQSMGAAAVLRAVHNCGVRPDAIIVEAVFDKMLNAVRHRFEAMGIPSFPSAELLVFWGGHQAGFNGFAHNPVRYAVSVGCPILFLHGADDPRAHVDEARGVFAAVRAPKCFKEFSGLGHGALVAHCPDEWKKTVSQFLQEAENPPASGKNRGATLSPRGHTQSNLPERPLGKIRASSRRLLQFQSRPLEEPLTAVCPAQWWGSWWELARGRCPGRRVVGRGPCLSLGHCRRSGQ